MQLEMLSTERPNPLTRDLDVMSVSGLLTVMNQQDAIVAGAVAAVLPAIEAAVDLVVAARAQGGRLIYLGAGTSGRLGVLDAVECPPTFGTDPGEVIGIIAGGRIVTESTVSELRGQADLVVVAEPLSQAHQVIAGLVGDGAVAQQGDALRCQVPAQQVAEVNRALVSAGIDVTELRREEKSLEEVFLNLTGSGTTTGSEAANEGGSHVG